MRCIRLTTVYIIIAIYLTSSWRRKYENNVTYQRFDDSVDQAGKKSWFGLQFLIAVANTSTQNATKYIPARGDKVNTITINFQCYQSLVHQLFVAQFQIFQWFFVNCTMVVTFWPIRLIYRRCLNKIDTYLDRHLPLRLWNFIWSCLLG